MGQTTDQIADHIENKREDLKSNLQELETRVKSATDWRRYFKEHTGSMLAVAFGGGLLISRMMGKRSASNSAGESPGRARAATPGTRHEVFKNVDTISSALVGAAAAKFKGVLGEVVPGFREHLAQAENSRSGDSTH
jgi:hypothetical protein